MWCKNSEINRLVPSLLYMWVRLSYIDKLLSSFLLYHLAAIYVELLLVCVSSSIFWSVMHHLCFHMCDALVHTYFSYIISCKLTIQSMRIPLFLIQSSPSSYSHMCFFILTWYHSLCSDPPQFAFVHRNAT